MAKHSLLDFANLAANVQQSSSISRISKESAVALKKVEELLKNEQERQAREELERQRAELYSQRQKEIKDAVFELKQELDDLEEQDDRVARAVILSLLLIDIEEMDMSLDEFESLTDREYARQALNRLDALGAETESSLTGPERKQLADLDEVLELVEKKKGDVLEIEGGIEEFSRLRLQISERIDQREEELAQQAKKGKSNRNKGFVCIPLTVMGSFIADWAGVIFIVIGAFFLLRWILGAPGRILYRNSAMESQGEDRKQRDEIDAELQDLRTRLLLSVEEREQAEQALLAIVKDHPDLGFLVEKGALGDHEGAIADYDKALELNPQYTEAYNSRGNAKYASGDHEGAIADYDKAIECDPQHADAYSNRGSAKDASGDHAGAREDWARAREIDPNLQPPGS